MPARPAVLFRHRRERCARALSRAVRRRAGVQIQYQWHVPGQIKGGGNGQQRTEYGQQGSDDDDFGAIQKISLIDIVLSMTLRAPDNGE